MPVSLSHRFYAAATVAMTVVLTGCSAGASSSAVPTSDPAPTSATAPRTASASATRGSASASTPALTYAVPASQERVTVASGLDHPWSVAFLPDGSAFVTQRADRRILRLLPGSGKEPTTVATVSDADPAYEGGMLGLVVSPTFATDGFVYLYVTVSDGERVVRFHWDGSQLGDATTILSGIARSATYHHGGRLAFGPDGMLYVTTGDVKNSALAQDTSSLNGKILRIRPDGTIPPDNPFGNAVWSYGHRNVEGLLWDRNGTLLASEFGENTYDELNRIEKGKNYGWPTVEGPGGESRGFVDPLTTWKPTSTCSPSGIALAADGTTIDVACLAGQRIATVRWDGTTATQGPDLLTGLGRMRLVTPGPDGRMWVLTDNGNRSDTVLVLPQR